MKKILPFILIFFGVLIFYSPILINPKLILERENDLQEFFWPIFYFVKNQIITNHQIPLWNNLILSGTPLLPDPQAPIFYPLNIFALIMPLNLFFIFSFIFHSLIGGVGMYLCSSKGFRFSKTTSIILSLLYITTPKLVGYLEAGHVGLINSMAWIPFVLYATIKLSEKAKLVNSVFLALSLSLLFYSHLPTFLIIAVSSGIFLLLKKKLAYFLVAVILTFGLTAISILPQIEWQKNSTRYLLLKDKDVYPKWQSVFEIPKLALIPWIDGINSLQNIDSEKWISIGLIPFLLASYGFLKVKRKTKIILSILATLILAITLNNASPLYPILLKQNWYLLLRVSTRFWIFIILILIYLSGVAIENLSKQKKYKLIVYIASFFAIIESIVLGFAYLHKPVKNNQNLAPLGVYEYLASDKSLFRVFCLTRCLSQKTSSVYNLQLLDGYNTVQQKNFNQQAWQLMGAYWNYYTLSIPPIGSYTFDQLRPDAKSLGEYNVKYIISPYPLSDKYFNLVKKMDGFLIFENRLLIPRIYEIYKPNYIKANVEGIQKQLIISEVYSPGWKAYLNGKEEVAVQETPNTLRAVDIKPDTEFVDINYDPSSYKTGKYITILSLLFLIGYAIYKKGFKN